MKLPWRAMTAKLPAADIRPNRPTAEAVRAVTDEVARSWFLRLLRWGAGSSNLDVMSRMMPRIGLRLTRDAINDHAQWLAARGHIRATRFERVSVYELTRSGDDLARGLTYQEGVAPVSLSDATDDDAVLQSVRSPPATSIAAEADPGGGDKS